MKGKSTRGLLGSIALLVAVALLVLRPWESRATDEGPAAIRARIVRVVDGDTVEVDELPTPEGGKLIKTGKVAEDVRLIGVDTPETVKPDTPIQCFGPQASTFSHHLLEGRTVRLVFGVERHDIYGRALAYAYLGRRFVNAILVRRGLARTLTIPPNDRYAALFERLEMRAARAGRGLWGAC